MLNTSQKKEIKVLIIFCNSGKIISEIIQTMLKWYLTFLLFLQYYLNISKFLAKLVI